MPDPSEREPMVSLRTRKSSIALVPIDPNGTPPLGGGCRAKVGGRGGSDVGGEDGLDCGVCHLSRGRCLAAR